MNHLQEHSFIPIDEVLLKALGMEKKEDLVGKLKVRIDGRPGTTHRHEKGGTGLGDWVREPRIEFL